MLSAEKYLSWCTLIGPDSSVSLRDLAWGSSLGGRLADWRLGAALTGVFIALALSSALLRWTSPGLLPVEINLFLWAAIAFAAVSGLQINVMIFGKAAPNLIATLNIGAFNVGNALGAWVGGLVISHGFGLPSVPLAAAALALGAVAAMRLSLYFSQRLDTNGQAAALAAGA